MKNTKFNFLKVFSKGYVIGLGILLGLGSAFAITAITTETNWTESSFENGAAITQNMLLSQTMGYTCYNSTCTQKVYWRKFNGNQYSQPDAVNFCKSQGMRLPSYSDYLWLRTKTLPGLDYSAGYINMGTSLSQRSSRHWTTDKSMYVDNNSRGCTYSRYMPGYDYYNNRSSRGARTQCYNSAYILCVY